MSRTADRERAATAAHTQQRTGNSFRSIRATPRSNAALSWYPIRRERVKSARSNMRFLSKSFFQEMQPNYNSDLLRCIY
jgi:hypothetical protein